MKRIIVIAGVKNESDIIESFCRYNLSYADAVLIYENKKSSDNTREIISKLIDEGLPIYFEDEDDMYYETAKKMLVNLAVCKYNADIVLPLDTDEFLCHTDGINPRELLEAMAPDTEYHAVWRTYVYKKEPDLKPRFMPDNFTCYRNPKLEDPEIYSRHKKTIVSRYLVENLGAAIDYGAHFLVYPDEYKDAVKTEICEKLVVAHFPIRSNTQIMRKVVPNWINKWLTHNYRRRRHALDSFHLGVLFNELKKSGELTPQVLRQSSIEYAMLLDADTSGELSITRREELDELIQSFGENLTVYGPMETDFCKDKLTMEYTDYSGGDDAFMRATLDRIDAVITFLSDESDERQDAIDRLTQENETLRHQLEGIYASKTWKLSNKLARVYRKVFGSGEANE